MIDTIELSFDAFLRSFKQNIDTPFGFLLGAGASLSSGVPTAEDCIWDWKTEIYLTNNPAQRLYINSKLDECRTIVQEWLDSKHEYPCRGAENEYEFYIEKAYPIEDDRRRYFEKLVTDKSPYLGYKLLCLLQRYGVLRSVWTTNFDGLVERAAQQMQITPVIVNLDCQSNINKSESANSLLYVALHGDYKFSKLKNTAKELDAQNQSFITRLTSYFTDKHLIVCGYSGRDKSLMKSLTSAYSQEGPGRIYWCGFGPITENVKAFLTQVRANGREAYYVETDGFDKLMMSILKFSFQNDRNKITEINKVIASIPTNDNNSRFYINGTFGGFVKTNLYPISLPKDMYQFELKESKNESLRDTVKICIKGKQILAEQYGGRVYAFGLNNTIQEVFGAKLKTAPSRVPLSLNDVENIGSLRSLMLKLIICGLSSISNLNASISKRIIWDKNSIYSNRLGVYEAIKLKLHFRPKVNYLLLSLTPTLYFEDEDKYGKESKMLLIREYLDKIYNNKYEQLLSNWEAKLFKEKHTKIDYPLNSGNGFAFIISRNRGEVRMNYMAKGVIPNNDIQVCNHLYDGVLMDEPSLEFRQTPNIIAKHINPMRGLLSYEPYDQGLIQLDNSVNLAVICPQTKAESFSSFLNTLQGEHLYQGKGTYIENYPGFTNIYKCPINIPAINSKLWQSCKEEQTNTFDLAQNLCKYAEKLSLMKAGCIVVIYIPSSWRKHRSFNQNGESFDLHNYLKAYAAQHTFTTQIIEEKTLLDSRKRCEVCWWLSLALYVKSMRTPWALSALNNETAYAGIGYSLRKTPSGKVDIVLGCSHLYNAKGQGLKYKLSKIEDYVIDKKNNPYLSYNEAVKFGMTINDLFAQSMYTLPNRVVVHKRTPFKEEEIRGIVDSLSHTGITNIDLISMIEENSIRGIDYYGGAYISSRCSNYPILRGSCVILSENEFLLWTHGTITGMHNNKNYYAGGRGIPAPLRVTKYYGQSNLDIISTEILGLTKMNWNSFDFYTKFPATIDTSNTLAQVGNLLNNYNGITYDYRYFI